MDSATAIKTLVVDQDGVSRRLAALLLQRLGRPSPEFAEAVDALPSGPYDLVLAAVDPAAGQLETLRRHAAPARLIAVIAQDSELQRQACLRAGADAVLTKPLSLPALAAVLPRDPGDFDAATWAELRRLFGADGAARLAGVLADDLPVQQAGLARAASDGDCLGLRRIAHALQGVSLQLGATALAGLWSKVEAAATQGDAAGAGQLATELMRRHCSLVTEVRNESGKV
ncbi:MAG: response regulator [Stagnimonas sp.]|nr:response regulator [Stagnimonas sp.]